MSLCPWLGTGCLAGALKRSRRFQSSRRVGYAFRMDAEGAEIGPQREDFGRDDRLKRRHAETFLDEDATAAYIILMTKKVNIAVNPSRSLASEDAMAAAVAQRITALRKAQDFTFDALARRAGVAKGTLVQIEQERANPSISTLCRLAIALG